MANMMYDIEHPEKLEIVRDFDKNDIALARYKGKEQLFFINRWNLRVSDTFLTVSEFDGQYYAVKENDEEVSCAYYEFNGTTVKKASRNYSNCLPFNNEVDYGLVWEGYQRAENYNGELVYPCCFVDRDFTRVSPHYQYASGFDNVCGVARVEPLDRNVTFFVNDEFVQVSPDFIMAFGLDESGFVVGSEKEGCFAYYRYNGKEFKKVSKDFALARGFSNGNFTTVKDIETNKYYIINRAFNKVSDACDFASQFSGNPLVATIKQGKNLYYLSGISLSKIEDKKFYKRLFKEMEENGCDAKLSTIVPLIKQQLSSVEDKRRVLKDVKTAVKDYLADQLVMLIDFEDANEVDRYLADKLKVVDKVVKGIVQTSDEPGDN